MTTMGRVAERGLAMISESARADFRCLGKRKRIIDFDIEVSNGVLAFPKQYQNSSETAGIFVNHCGLGVVERII